MSTLVERESSASEMAERSVHREGSQDRGTNPVASVAYIMSRFPLLTETFILRELLELEKQGLAIAVLPLLRERPSVVHEEVERLAAEIHYTRFLSLPIIQANLQLFLRKPGRYLTLLWSVLRLNWGSANLCVGALGIFPKSVYFARLLERLGVRHVHAHYATHPALAAYIIAELTDVGFSFTAHAHDIFLHQHMLREKVERAQFVVAISEFNKEFLLRCAPRMSPDKIQVVHCGIELENYDAAAERRRSDASGDDPITAVCVGSLQPYKGLKYLVRACAEVVRSNPGFRCLIVGQGVDRPGLESLIAELDLQEVVQLLGGRPQHEVAALLRKADLFVLPSVVAPSGQMEGIPVALMEAMASRLPVVSTRLSGIPELVEDGVNGLLVPPADERALAAALIRLCNDPQSRHEMGERGRESVAEEFQLSGNVVRLRTFFENAVRDNGAGPACARRGSSDASRN
jgi:glycosyltransferase involved in cell wall biosynthesis